jgi:hypothetical protein
LYTQEGRSEEAGPSRRDVRRPPNVVVTFQIAALAAVHVDVVVIASSYAQRSRRIGRRRAPHPSSDDGVPVLAPPDDRARIVTIVLAAAVGV